MPQKGPARRQRRAHYYWWTLANTLAGCAAILSWLLSLHVFGHPEIPRNYKILQRLGLEQPAPGFALQQAPPGDAADPRALYRRYAQLDDRARTRLNRALMRNYLTGLGEPGLIQYVEGDFEVTAVRRLGAEDLFHPGIAVRARAMIRPDEFSEATPWPVTIDYLFPTQHSAVGNWFARGDRLEVAKVPNCAMLMHVARSDGGDTPVVRLTVVPIATGRYQVGSDRSFSIAAPEHLNPAAAFPAFPD
jgi:hypothetical protein